MPNRPSIMRKDRRGIGGFMETMVAMMIVTIALSAFMTMFAYSNLPEPEVPDVSTDFVEGLRLENGSIVGLDETYPEDESERRGYCSMTICIKVVGRVNDHMLEMGEPTGGCDQIIRNGTFMIPGEDGARYAAAYEVIAFV